MQTETFKSPRYFTLTDYLISHSQLLLRSAKNDENNFNLDIIFFDVKYIQLPVSFHGILIEISKNKEAIRNESINSHLKFKSNFIFEIETRMEKYYIVASFYRIFENQLEFNQTSLGVLEFSGREKEITPGSIL